MSRPVRVVAVPSLSAPGTYYDVAEYADGSRVCSCPAFWSWHKRGKPCWHVRVFDAVARAIDRCWTDHGTPDGFVCRACLLALVAGMSGAVKRRYVDKATATEKIKLARRRAPKSTTKKEKRP